MDNIPQDPREQQDYLSYLLRLWRVNEEETGWRASLESSYTGGRKGFANLDALFDFLRNRTGAISDADNDENKTSSSEEVF